MPEHFPQPQPRMERLEPEADFSAAQKEIGFALLEADETRNVLSGAMRMAEALPRGEGRSDVLLAVQNLMRKLDVEERELENLLVEARDVTA